MNISHYNPYPCGSVEYNLWEDGWFRRWWEVPDRREIGEIADGFSQHPHESSPSQLHIMSSFLLFLKI
jgi:hypothetical protein